MDFNAAWPVLVIVIGYLALLFAGGSFRSEVNSILKSDYNLLFFSIFVGISFMLASELIIMGLMLFCPGLYSSLSVMSEKISENFLTVRSFFPFKNEEHDGLSLKNEKHDDKYFVSVLIISFILMFVMWFVSKLSIVKNKTTNFLLRSAKRRGGVSYVLSSGFHGELQARHADIEQRKGVYRIRRRASHYRD